MDAEGFLAFMALPTKIYGLSPCLISKDSPFHQQLLQESQRLIQCQKTQQQN